MFFKLKGFERLSKDLESLGILNFTLPYLTSLNLTIPIGGDSESPDKEIEIEKDKPVPPKNNYSEDFLEFRNVYPKKKSKVKAYEAWNKKKNKPDIQTITQKIQDMIAEHDYKNKMKEFIEPYKHPSTWINQECWDDEYETQKIIKPKKFVDRRNVEI